MSVETLSYLMALAVQVVTILQIVIMLSGKRRFRFTVIALVGYAVVYYAVLHFTGSMPVSGSGLRGLVWLPPVLLLFKGLFFQRVFAFFLQYLLVFSQYSLGQLLVGLFLQSGSEMFNLISLITTLALYAAYITIMIIYGRVFFQKVFSYGRETEWALYAFGAAFSFAIPIVNRIAPDSEVDSIMSLLFALWSFAVLCFAIVNTHEKYKQKYEAEFAREVISSGREHYQKMDELHDKLRTMRHDYKYHLIAIDELLASNNKEELRRYLNGIQAQLSESEVQNFCSNSVINALLVRYTERCAKLGIEFTADIVLPETISVPNYEMCIVVGNLLENAVEACQKQSGVKNIEIILKPLGEQLALRVKNSFDGQIFENNGRFISLKKNGGFGLRSIDAVADRYDGELLLNQDDGVFSAYVTMRL